MYMYHNVPHECTAVSHMYVPHIHPAKKKGCHTNRYKLRHTNRWFTRKPKSSPHKWKQNCIQEVLCGCTSTYYVHSFLLSALSSVLNITWCRKLSNIWPYFNFQTTLVFQTAFCTVERYGWNTIFYFAPLSTVHPFMCYMSGSVCIFCLCHVNSSAHVMWMISHFQKFTFSISTPVFNITVHIVVNS